MKTKLLNDMIRPIQIVMLAILAFLLLSCNSSEFSNETAVNQSEATTGGEGGGFLFFETESILYSQEELFAQADLIFAGEVLEISPTRWNQDSGEYWAETTVEGRNVDGELLTTTHAAWPVYEIRLSVTQPMVDELGIGKEVVLTLLGKSPVDDVSSHSEIDIHVDAESVNVQKGQELVIFASLEELTWRDPNRPIEIIRSADGNILFDLGSRKIITLTGLYANAYLVKGSDGLYHHTENATNQQAPISLDNMIKNIPLN